VEEVGQVQPGVIESQQHVHGASTRGIRMPYPQLDMTIVKAADHPVEFGTIDA
jgi:hypothetical protein